MEIEMFRIRSRGMTFIECLIALFLMLLIIASLLEITRSCRRFFFTLKESQEFNQEIWAGQDRIRQDLNKAGLGLEPLLVSGLLLAVESKGTGLSIYSRESSFPLKIEAPAGSTTIHVSHNNSISRGQLITLIDGQKIELFRTEKVEKDRLTLSQPTKESYSINGFILAIEEVFYYLDEENRILRRRVNASSGQPLLENVKHFSWSIDNSGKIKITLTFVIAKELSREKERNYEITAFPKNVLIAQSNPY